MIFFDTNVIAYMFEADDPRTGPATQLVKSGGVVSVQVLNELVAVLGRKSRMSRRDLLQAPRYVADICDVVPLTEAIHVKALSLVERHQLHIYDANIWASAILSGCEILYSEDMHAGLTIDSTTLANPFAG